MLKRKASFFVDFDKRDVDDEALIVATVLDANNNIVGFSETVADSEPPHVVQSANRLPDQSEQHARRALQLREEHARDRRRRILAAVARLRHARTPSRAFSSRKQRSSTRRSSTRRASSLNIRHNCTERRQLDSDDRRAGSIHRWRIAGGPVTQHDKRLGTDEQHFVRDGRTFVESRRSLSWRSHRSILAAELRRHLHVLRRRSWSSSRCERSADSADTEIITSIERFRRTQVFLAQGLTGAQIRAARRRREPVSFVVRQSGDESQPVGLRRFFPGRLEAAAKLHAQSRSALREPEKHRQQFELCDHASGLRGRRADNNRRLSCVVATACFTSASARI